jgi:L-amino acid N-acyltransferase YncA
VSDGRPTTTRPATISDLPEIVAIYNKAIETGGSVADPEPITVASRLHWFLEHGRSDRPLLVMEMESRIVAWASLHSYSPTPAFRRTAEVSVFVSNGHQGAGYGARLLGRLLDDCPKIGVDVVLGTMFADNLRVIKMNERLGLTAWGRLPRVANIKGKERDLLFMGIDLRERRSAG